MEKKQSTTENKIRRVDSYEFDERYYQRYIGDDTVEYAPSVTYVIGATYPSYGLDLWRGDVGNKRADEIMEQSAEDGSYVHDAIERILKGEEVHSDEIRERFSGKRSLKIKRCLKAFMDWYEEYKPEVLSTEYIIWGNGYAGTVDLKCVINGETYIVDFKTSKSIHGSHKVQIAAYGMADDVQHVALLQVGNKTKKRYSFNVLKEEDRKRYEQEWDKTLALFQTLHPNAQPTSETFPDVFKV